MDLLQLPLDVFKLIIKKLKLKDQIYLYSVSRRYKKYIEERIWARKMNKYPPLSNKELKSVIISYIGEYYEGVYLNYMKVRYNRMNLFINTFNKENEINRICGRSVIVKNEGITKITRDSKGNILPPYFWKDVFISINKYLNSIDKEPIKEKIINTKGLNILEIPRLKYEECCIKYIKELEVKLDKKYIKYKFTIKQMKKCFSNAKKERMGRWDY
jgi:hypothetical protein